MGASRNSLRIDWDKDFAFRMIIYKEKLKKRLIAPLWCKERAQIIMDTGKIAILSMFLKL